MPTAFKNKLLRILFVLLLVSFFYFSIFTKPSNNRDWQEQYNVLPRAEITQNKVAINNIRDWRYDGENLTSKDYINKTFDPTKITKVWFVLEPFGDFKPVAHTYFVFDFENEEPVAVSVEARRENTEDYSGFWGLFNQYELIYIWGTEEDQAIRRSVIYEDKLYMFPLKISQEASQKLFIHLAQETKALEENPRFYNTLTSNCTNELAKNANKVKPGTIPFTYSLLPGYSAESLYKLGLIDNSQPLDALREKYYITDFVKDNYKSTNLSSKLRDFLK